MRQDLYKYMLLKLFRRNSALILFHSSILNYLSLSRLTNIGDAIFCVSRPADTGYRLRFALSETQNIASLQPETLVHHTMNRQLRINDEICD